MDLGDHGERGIAYYRAVRACTEAICAPLSAEDCMVQACDDVSPAKWHMAHTSWFFDRFVLRGLGLVKDAYHPSFDFIFNSYYEGAGRFHPRGQRGLLARPSLDDVKAYRRYVDEQVLKFFSTSSPTMTDEALRLLEIGAHHEQQHQELLLTDIKYNTFVQALAQAPYPALPPSNKAAQALQWITLPTGLHRIGLQSEAFGFDNESPAHLVYIGDVALADRPISNGEYMAFIEEGGYKRPGLWLSEGWQWLNSQGIEQPLYWEKAADGSWRQFTLHGWQALDPLDTLCHISYYEADAYARWRQARLPSEQEWEVFARTQASHARPFDLNAVQPRRAAAIGEVWEWTMSSYSPYPGYRSWEGTLGEYNGKFMVNQYVLRGGSCASPEGHIRSSYRNFFPPIARWQFSGLRLAKDFL